MNIEMKKIIGLFCSLVALLSLSGCFSAKSTSMAGRGGEVVGVSGRGVRGAYTLRNGKGEPWFPEDGS